MAALLGACSALPSSGPGSSEVERLADNEVEGRYVLVDVDDRSAAILARHSGPSFRTSFGDSRPAPQIRIGVGDVVNVSIWEAAEGGLFSAGGPIGSRSATVSPQQVTQDGTIQVPYAGRLPVVGRTPAQAEAAIVAALAGKAIEPQVVVTVPRALSSTVVLTGEATPGARIPLSAAGDRILDVVASGGGILGTAHDVLVRLTRGNTTVTVPFEVILSNPRENIFTRPGDAITLVREPQTFSALGALGGNRLVPFSRVTMSLEEAVATAGGLLEERSDVDGIFLLRFEPAAIVRSLVPTREIARAEVLIPVVYRLSLRDPRSYFIARTFRMRDKDILYVANAASLELQKFLSVAQTVLSQSAVMAGIAQTAAGSISVGRGLVLQSIAVPPVATPGAAAVPAAAATPAPAAAPTPAAAAAR
ncbi:MAG: hypothetical protein JWQ36_3112 [Enterovirga sp.]|nr:hypothetical protein [Enterovirga sp.]